MIDASPVFRNTCAKYAALLAAGAELTAAVSLVMPHDPETVALLGRYGTVSYTHLIRSSILYYSRKTSHKPIIIDSFSSCFNNLSAVYFLL